MVRTNWVPGIAAVAAALLLTTGAASARPLSVEVWTDRGDDAVYTPGEQMLVKARTNDDAYLLVYEIDAEGGITVLFPFRRAAGMVEGRSTLRLPPEDSRYELAVDQVTGQGFIVAIASRRPFRDLPWYLRPFDPQAASIGWEDRHDDVEGFDEDGRVVGDPYVAIERIRQAVLGDPADLDEFSTSYTSYYVGHEVRYPRYLCYDCHRPDHWSWWDGFDPYYAQCSVIDFRVNWNWCWGPCLWTAHTPYYYYVVRSNCPPRYRPWYEGHDRWSSWDGRHRWDDLWGGPLVRHKGPPPVGYLAPPTKPSDQPRTKPPGYISSSTTFKGAGGREYLPVGRNRPDTGGDGQRGISSGWRTPAQKVPVTRDGSGGGKGSSSGDRFGGKDAPRFEPPHTTAPEGGPKYEPRGDSPRHEQPRQPPPSYSPPREERRDPPRQSPPSYSPPREEHRDPPRQSPPSYSPPREQPRNDPPRESPKPSPPQQSPKQEPRQDGGSSGGGGKHRGGGGH